MQSTCYTVFSCRHRKSVVRRPRSRLNRRHLQCTSLAAVVEGSRDATLWCSLHLLVYLQGGGAACVASQHRWHRQLHTYPSAAAPQGRKVTRKLHTGALGQSQLVQSHIREIRRRIWQTNCVLLVATATSQLCTVGYNGN